MKHRRRVFIFVWVALVTLMISALSVSVYQLYRQAEKAQKAAFTGKVLIAGKEISDRVNSLINDEYRMDSAAYISDPRDFVKQTIATIDGQPRALIAETVADYQGTMVILEKDTTYFSAEDHPEYVLIDTSALNYTVYTDSLISQISLDSIRLCISTTLLKYNLDLYYDFAIYNLPKGTFSIQPKYAQTDILNNGYVFALTTNNSEVYTHYFVLTFPNERGFFLRKMSNIVLPIVGLIVLIVVIIVIMLILLAQQRRIQETKNDFVNNMTHEFKTPLATICLACEALTDPTIHNDREAANSFINIIKDENQRLQKMVNNILQIARLKKGQLHLNKEKVDVHELLLSICNNISLQVNNNGGKVVTHYDAENSEIIADRSHIESILVNIIENAIKYTPENPVIKINTHNEKDLFVVAISDNGIGISKKNIRHIFDEFFRVSTGNLHDAKGYGLGLNYVKKIVDLHDGRIKVTSALGAGTTFTIYLPIK